MVFMGISLQSRTRLLDDIGGAARREVKAKDAAARRDAVLMGISLQFTHEWEYRCNLHMNGNIVAIYT